MSATEGKCTGNLENCESYKHSNITGKFKAYRMFTESTKTKLKEAETVIEELKNEIHMSRNSEKNLRSQITSVQNRLICLQETTKKFINISDQQLQNEKTSQRIQEKIQEFEENISQIRQKSQNILQCVTRELELLKKIKEVESFLEAKNRECDFMKMEIQTLTKKGKNIEFEFQEKIKNLENSLENLRKKESEAQDHYRETLLYYKQQIDDYERKIERYEKERKSFLEDFEPPKPSQVNPYKFASADSTVSMDTEKRSPISSSSKKRNIEPENKVFQCSSIVGKSKTTNFKKSQNLSRISKKEKPQLEFLTQDSTGTINSENTGRKRRLFSTNRNHYID